MNGDNLPSSWEQPDVYVDRASTPPLPDWLIRASHRGYELLNSGHGSIPEVSAKSLPAPADSPKANRPAPRDTANMQTRSVQKLHDRGAPISSTEVPARPKTERPTQRATPGDLLSGLRNEMPAGSPAPVRQDPLGLRGMEPPAAARPATAPPTPRPRVPEPDTPSRSTDLFRPKPIPKTDFHADFAPEVDTRQQRNLIPPPKATPGAPQDPKNPAPDAAQQGRLGNMFKKFFGE